MSGKNLDMLTSIPDLTGRKWKDIRVCQLGNQFVKGGRKPEIGKDYLEQVYGARKVVVIDLYDHPFEYIHPLDLGKPIDRWNNYFDMVTNFGTSEHVWNQYQVFRNMHNFLGEKGMFIHCVPITLDHAEVAYSEEFFKSLCSTNRYREIFKEIWWGNKLLKIILQKTDGEFCSEEIWEKEIKTFMEEKNNETI